MACIPPAVKTLTQVLDLQHPALPVPALDPAAARLQPFETPPPRPYPRR